MYHTLSDDWRVSVHQPDLRISQHFIILWRISRSTRASSWIITSVQQRPQFSMVFATQTGERATAVDRSLVKSSGITELRSHGNPSFRSRWRSRPLRRSTTPSAWRGGGHLSLTAATRHGLQTHISDAGL